MYSYGILICPQVYSRHFANTELRQYIGAEREYSSELGRVRSYQTNSKMLEVVLLSHMLLSNLGSFRKLSLRHFGPCCFGEGVFYNTLPIRRSEPATLDLPVEDGSGTDCEGLSILCMCQWF